MFTKSDDKHPRNTTGALGRDSAWRWAGIVSHRLRTTRKHNLRSGTIRHETDKALQQQSNKNL
jgi:hypothetical protein